MEKKSFVKTISGLTIMFSVFLLLLVATRFNDAVEGAKHAISPTREFVQTSLISNRDLAATPPRNVVEGFFNVDRDGDLTEVQKQNGKIVTKHYRAIQADMLKDVEGKPVLKLQVYDNNKKSWIVTDIERVDHEDGKIYFLLKTEEDNAVVPNNYYTGTYQLILE